jgi:hypothetical protein
MAQESRKSELIAELARSRQALAHSLENLRHTLDVKQRVSDAVTHNKMAWLTGASFTGFLFAKLSARRKSAPSGGRAAIVKSEQKVVKAGLIVTVLKLAFDLARPALAKWLTRRVTDYATQRFASEPRR